MYYDNLSKETPIKSHCYLCLLSDPSQPEFHSDCKKNHEGNRCDNCDSITDLFIIMENILSDESIMANYSDHEKGISLLIVHYISCKIGRSKLSEIATSCKMNLCIHIFLTTFPLLLCIFLEHKMYHLSLSTTSIHFADLMLYRLSESTSSIREYMRFICRMYAQNLVWRNLQEGKTSSSIFVTTDW